MDKKVIKLENHYTELQSNVITVERWKRQSILKGAAVIILFILLATILFGLVVAFADILVTFEQSFGAYDGLQR